MIIHKKTFMQTIATFLMLLYAFTTGLTSYIYQNATGLAMSFGMALLIMLYYGMKKVQLNFNVLLAILMLIVILFNNNHNIEHGSYTTLYYTVAIIVFYILSMWCNAWHKAFLGMLIFFGLFYSLCTILLMFLPSVYKNVVLPIFETSGYSSEMWSLYQQGCMAGFTPHYSTNAMYLVVCFGVPVAYLIGGNKKHQVRNVGLGILILVALLLTGKRAHVFFGLGAFIVSYYYLNSNRPVQRWHKIIAMVVLGVVVITIAAEIMPSLLNVVYRFVETSESGDITMGREAQRLLALELFKEHSWLGMGWDGYKYYYEGITGYQLNVHCVYVQLLCEAGIIGSIPFFLFFYVSIKRIIKTILFYIKKANFEIGWKDKACLAYSLFLQVFFLLYCLTGNPLYDSQMLIPYMLACAIGEFYYNRSKQELIVMKERG